MGTKAGAQSARETREAADRMMIEQNTALKAKVERLRAALEDARNALHNDFEPDNQSNAYKRASRALEASRDEQSWKWICESCGTLSNDKRCDCTKFGRPGKFIPFEAKRL